MSTNPQPYSIADLKTRQLPAFFEKEQIVEGAEGGRHLLMTKFMDELEDDWNIEHRDLLKKTNCPKEFTAADVLRYADVEEVTDDTPQPYKDRVNFAEFLNAGGATEPQQ